MSQILISEEYSVIIDTNSESFSFAKKLCAYCTGFTSEDEADQKFSDLFYMEMGIEDDDSPKGKTCTQKNPFYDCIADRKDDNDVFSPCSVWLNRLYGCNETGQYDKLTEENYDEYDLPAPFSVGIFFDTEPTEDQLKIIKERAVKFFVDVWLKLSNVQVAVEGFRLVKHRKYGEEKEI